MRWIKASERLPGSNIDVYVKCNGKKYLGHVRLMTDGIKKCFCLSYDNVIYEENFYKVEWWLDESPLPSNDEDELLRHWKIFIDEFNAKQDRILRDKGLSNRDILNANNDVFTELIAKFSITRKPTQ